MINFRSEKGGALVLTFITTLILSMLGMAILPLTVLEYRSSHNFADFEKSYFIAEAGMEKAIAELSEDWSYSGTTGQNLDKGIYDIAIDGSGDLKTITATGKIGNTQRTIEAQVERTASYYNLSEMKDYAIFAQGDLNIEELGYIYGGIIGVHGDLHFESAEQDGGAQLMVEAVSYTHLDVYKRQVELIIVIAILGILSSLIGIGIPAYQRFADKRLLELETRTILQMLLRARSCLLYTSRCV